MKYSFLFLAFAAHLCGCSASPGEAVAIPPDGSDDGLEGASNLDGGPLDASKDAKLQDTGADDKSMDAQLEDADAEARAD
jgi:hypothetical protein